MCTIFLLLGAEVSATCCVCTGTVYSNISEEDIQRKIHNIQAELTLKHRSLTSYSRKKSSAADTRYSSVAMGAVAICLLSAVFGLFILADIAHFRKGVWFIKRMIRKIKRNEI